MLRARQEKEQLVRKFESIAPFLKSLQNFAWVYPKCHSDPYYRIMPDYSGDTWDFRPFNVNIKTGWHSEITFRKDGMLHYIPEGIAKIESRDWSDYCGYANCQGEHHIPYPRRTN